MAAVTQELKEFVQTEINRALFERLGAFSPGLPEGASQLMALQSIEHTVPKVTTLEAGMLEVNAKVDNLREELRVLNIEGMLKRLDDATVASEASMTSKDKEIRDKLDGEFARITLQDKEIRNKLDLEFASITAQLKDVNDQAKITSSAQVAMVTATVWIFGVIEIQ